MSCGDFEDDWEPLSQAEMKVIQAKQERSNKISKIMGDYLLKGSVSIMRDLAKNAVIPRTGILRTKQIYVSVKICDSLHGYPFMRIEKSMDKVSIGGRFLMN